MAALTWRDVAAPDYRGVQGSINSAADLLAKSTSGLSGALTQFGDQQALQQLAAYTDAQKLQADIQSGRFNVANASPEALATIMGRPSSLLKDAASQQTLTQDALMNPGRLTTQTLTNDTSQEALNQSRLMNPYLLNSIKRADQLGIATLPNQLEAAAQTGRLAAVQNPAAVTQASRTIALADRTHASQEDAYAAQNDLRAVEAQGGLATQSAAMQVYNNAVAKGASGPYIDQIKATISARFPAAFAPVGGGANGDGLSNLGSVTPVGTGAAALLTSANPATAGTQNGSSYDVVYGSGEGGLPLPPKPVTQSTVGEVVDWGKNVLIPATKGTLKDSPGLGTSAVGKYQFTQGTLNEYGPKVLGADWRNQPFDAANQDKLAEALFNDRKGGNLKDTWQGLPNTAPGAYKDIPWAQMKEMISAVESPVNPPTNAQQLSVENNVNKAATQIGLAATSSGQDQRLIAAYTKNDDKETVIKALQTGTLSGMSDKTIREAFNKITKDTGERNYNVMATILEDSVGTVQSFNPFNSEASWTANPFGGGKYFDTEALDANILAHDSRKSKLLRSVAATDNANNLMADLTKANAVVKTLTEEVAVRQQQVDQGMLGAPAALAASRLKLNDALGKVQQLNNMGSSVIESKLPVGKAEEESKKLAADAAKAAEAASKDKPAAAAALLAAAAAKKVKVPLRSTDGGKTWWLEVDETIRKPGVKHYQQIENPVYTAVNGKSFKSAAEAERAYLEALKANSK